MLEKRVAELLEPVVRGWVAHAAVLVAALAAGGCRRASEEEPVKQGGAPTYEELCRRYRLPLPRAFHALVELAHEVDPEEPEGAFDRIGLAWLELFDGSGGEERWPGDDGRWPDTPAEVAVFADVGADGAHYGFLIDGDTSRPEEYPIVHVFPHNGCEIVGSNFRDFLGHSVASWLEVYEDEGEEPPADFSRIVKLLESRIGVRVPPSSDVVEKRALAERLATRGVVPTADGLGVVLPPESVDRAYLAGLRWPADESRAEPDLSLLDEAERRLARGEHGTALVLARNFRGLFWHHDWKSGRRIIRRTAAILEGCYGALGWDRAAANIRGITDWAIANVE